MNNPEYLEIGILAKLHGFKGEYTLVSDSLLNEEIEDWESVFIEVDGLPVPFFIESFRFISDNSAVIGFEDFNSEVAAREFVGCRVLQLANMVTFEEETDASMELSGYKVTDSVAGEIGIVDRILDYNQNLLLQVMNNKEEILIPLSDKIVVSVNHSNKQIVINAPQGLLDLNR